MAADTANQVEFVRYAIESTGLFGTVDAITVSSGTPTIDQLAPYSSVFVYDNTPFPDAGAMGDLLADYVDAGGRVVLGAAADCADVFRVRGRFESDGYMLLDEGGVLPAKSGLGAIGEPESPILVGVGDSLFKHCDLSPLSDATEVVSLDDGSSLAVRGRTNGRNRVDINAIAIGAANDPVFRLIANALRYPRD